MPEPQACYHPQAELSFDIQQQRLHSVAQKSAAKLAKGTTSGQVMASALLSLVCNARKTAHHMPSAMHALL
jgi:hypothetical protein